MAQPIDHEDYIANASEPMQGLLRNIRKQLSHTLKDADEIVAYNMPGFKIGDIIVAGYAAFTKQCGIYVSPNAISSLSKEIKNAGLKATKTGVTYSPSKPIPDELIMKLTQASRKDHDVRIRSGDEKLAYDRLSLALYLPIDWVHVAHNNKINRPFAVLGSSYA